MAEANKISVTRSQVTPRLQGSTNKRDSTGTSVLGEAEFTDGVKKKALQIRDEMYGDADIPYQDIQIREGADPRNPTRFEWSSVDGEGKISAVQEQNGKRQSKEIETPLSRDVSNHVRDAIRRASADKKYTPEEVDGLQKLNKKIVDAVLKGNLASEAKHINALADSIAPNAPKTKLSADEVSI